MSQGMLSGRLEIRELLNRWKLLYMADTGECYGYAEHFKFMHAFLPSSEHLVSITTDYSLVGS